MPVQVDVPPTLLVGLFPSPSLINKAKGNVPRSRGRLRRAADTAAESGSASDRRFKMFSFTQFSIRYLLGSRAVFATTFAVCMAIQLRHLHPSLPGGDSGELMACCRWLLLAHPPGYPLYITLCHYLASAVVSIAESTQNQFAEEGFSVVPSLLSFSQQALSMIGWDLPSDPLTQTLFSSDAGNGGDYASNYLWVMAMHSVSALFHALAAAVLSVMVLQCRSTLDPATVWDGVTTEQRDGLMRTLRRRAGVTSETIETISSHVSSREERRRGKTSNNSRQVALLAGNLTEDTVETRIHYSLLNEFTFHCIAVSIGIFWCCMRGVLPFGTQVEVFALNDLFVALMLYLWIKEESVYALNSCSRLGKRLSFPSVVEIPQGFIRLAASSPYFSMRPLMALLRSGHRHRSPAQIVKQPAVAEEERHSPRMKSMCVPPPLPLPSFPLEPLQTAARGSEGDTNTNSPVMRQLTMDEASSASQGVGEALTPTFTLPPTPARATQPVPTHDGKLSHALTRGTRSEEKKGNALAPSSSSASLSKGAEASEMVQPVVSDPTATPSVTRKASSTRLVKSNSGSRIGIRSGLPPLSPPSSQASPLASSGHRLPSAGGEKGSFPASLPSMSSSLHERSHSTPQSVGNNSSVAYDPSFSSPVSLYLWWVLLASVAMCHQHAILFLTLPILLRVLYLHIFCSARHTGVTVALLVGALLSSMTLCLCMYYLLLSRVLDRTHAGSWGFSSEHIHGHRDASSFGTETSFASASYFAMQPLPSYFSVLRHFVRSDYGSFSLHSGRGGVTGDAFQGGGLWGIFSNYNLHTFVQKMSLAFDYGLQNMPWWVWVLHVGSIVFMLAERGYKRAVQRIEQFKLWVVQMNTTAGGAVHHKTMPAKPLPRGASTDGAAPTSPSSAHTAGVGAGFGGLKQTPRSASTPNTPAAGISLRDGSQGGATPRSGGVFAAVTNGAKRIGSFPSSDAWSGLFTPTPSSTPTTAVRDYAEAMSALEGHRGEDRTRAVNNGLPLVSKGEIALHIDPKAVFTATSLLTRRVRVWSVLFALVNIVVFNIMANIDLRMGMGGGMVEGPHQNQFNEQPIALHVYHRFWLQSLLPVALSVGVSISRLVTELLSATSLRRASGQTSVLVMTITLLALSTFIPLAPEDRLPMRHVSSSTAPFFSASSSSRRRAWDLREALGYIGIKIPPFLAPYLGIKSEDSERNRAEEEGLGFEDALLNYLPVHFTEDEREGEANAAISKRRRHRTYSSFASDRFFPYHSPLHEYIGTYHANLSHSLAAYGRSALASLPLNSILVTSGDQHLTAIRFTLWVIGYRTDVVHIDRELAHYGWYRDGLMRQRGVRIQSPAVEPLLQTLVTNPQQAHVPSKEVHSHSKLDSQRRLFALEDGTLTASHGDGWRSIATPVYNGWYYEILLNTQRVAEGLPRAKKGSKKQSQQAVPSALLRQRLCDGAPVGIALEESDMEWSPFTRRYLVHTSESNKRGTGSHRIVYDHPQLQLAMVPLNGSEEKSSSSSSSLTIPFFSAFLPRNMLVITPYYPWESAVLSHYSLSLKNALLAEAVRIEMGCPAAKGDGGMINAAASKKGERKPPSSPLKALAHKAHGALSPHHYLNGLWYTAVMPFLNALEPFQ